MLDLAFERDALYGAVMSCDTDVFVTQAQVGGLIGLVNQGLVDKSRKNRIAVMRYLIGNAIQDKLGVPFESYKNMTSGIATMLIDLLLEPETKPWKLNDYGRELLTSAEKVAQVSVAKPATETVW